MSKPKSVYLVAQYYAKPKDKRYTHLAGYMKDPNNIAWDEQVNLTLGLKAKDEMNAKIILNITNQTVVKNGFGVDRSFMELFGYFYESNPQQISHALQRFGFSVGKPEESTSLSETPTVTEVPSEHSST